MTEKRVCTVFSPSLLMHVNSGFFVILIELINQCISYNNTLNMNRFSFDIIVSRGGSLFWLSVKSQSHSAILRFD